MLECSNLVVKYGSNLLRLVLRVMLLFLSVLMDVNWVLSVDIKGINSF